MARTVKPEEFAAKRAEILDAAQRLVFTKGYEQMSLRDILNELRISSGAFHHYFGSREALLEAFIDRIREESGKPLLAIVHDPYLTAIEKLQGFFDTLDQLRIAHKTDIVQLGQVWYMDGNALVRQRVDEAMFNQRAPWLTEIVRQGIREGVFTSAYPDQAGEIILSLVQGMGATHARLMLALDQASDVQPLVEAIVTTHGAYMEAVERVLGAPANVLSRTDADALKVWVTALRGQEKED